MTAPKVFISHATEDKERFVIPFAQALRSQGVDAWVDLWEMLPGDSLVDKVFDEGIAGSSVIIVVLSQVSLLKPWVREELNAAVVKRIDDNTKLIPIVLDGCKPPTALRHTFWERVDDTANFETCLQRVVDAIYGRTRKPPLGPSPARHDPARHSIGDLSATDGLVLSVLYKASLTSFRQLVSPNFILAELSGHGLNAAALSESLEILEHGNYVRIEKQLGAGPYDARIASRGISAILGPLENDLIKNVGFAIINAGLTRADKISEKTGDPMPLVEHAFRLLQNDGHLSVSTNISGPSRIYNVKPTLSRMLSAGD